MGFKKNWKKFRKKLESLSMKEKALFFLYMIIIYLALFFLYMGDTKQTILYKSPSGEILCKEIYINGELNSSPCPEKYKNNNNNRLYDDKINFSEINISQGR